MIQFVPNCLYLFDQEKARHITHFTNYPKVLRGRARTSTVKLKAHNNG